MAPKLAAKSLSAHDQRRTPQRTSSTLEALADVVRRFPLHPGAPLLRPHAAVKQNPTRSGVRGRSSCRSAERFGLPTPRLNTIVHGYEVDAYFEAERLIVELDGWDFHNDRGAFEDDRERDATMLLLRHRDDPDHQATASTRDPEREAARLHAHPRRPPAKLAA